MKSKPMMGNGTAARRKETAAIQNKLHRLVTPTSNRKAIGANQIRTRRLH